MYIDDIDDAVRHEVVRAAVLTVVVIGVMSLFANLLATALSSAMEQQAREMATLMETFRLPDP